MPVTAGDEKNRLVSIGNDAPKMIAITVETRICDSIVTKMKANAGLQLQARLAGMSAIHLCGPNTLHATLRVCTMMPTWVASSLDGCGSFSLWLWQPFC